MSQELASFENFENAIFKPRPNVELNRIIGDLQYYDLEAVYQRQECWPVAMQQNLIRSILKGIPIGTIHAVFKDKDSLFYFVLDGKQRLAAIRNFINNKFKVKWGKKEYYWRDLHKEENLYLLKKIRDYQTNLLDWEPLSLLDSRSLFEIINQQSGLNTAEKIFCPNFFARCFFFYIYNTCLKKIAQNARTEVATNKRFSAILWTHRICQIIFGHNLNDVFAIRDIKKKTAQKSARDIDNVLCVYFNESIADFNENSINDEVIKRCFKDLSQKLNALKNLCNSLHSVINFKNDLIKHENAVNITDIIIFFYEKIEQKVLTTSQIDENLELFHQFYNVFKTEKTERNLEKHTTDVDSIRIRYNLFNEVFKNLEIDKGIKNKNIPIEEIANSLLNADKYCPITGELLREDNIQIDHIDPKSKSSKTDYKAVSQKANKMKSNLTTNQIQKLMEYKEDFATEKIPEENS